MKNCYLRLKNHYQKNEYSADGSIEYILNFVDICFSQRQVASDDFINNNFRSLDKSQPHVFDVINKWAIYLIKKSFCKKLIKITLFP